MINWSLMTPRNFIVIGLIILLTRLAFYSAVNALDGKSATQVSTQ
jgi:hypothetical protein